jgi:hypothetical protein
MRPITSQKLEVKPSLDDERRLLEAGVTGNYHHLQEARTRAERAIDPEVRLGELALAKTFERRMNNGLSQLFDLFKAQGQRMVEDVPGD